MADDVFTQTGWRGGTSKLALKGVNVATPAVETSGDKAVYVRQEYPGKFISFRRTPSKIWRVRDNFYIYLFEKRVANDWDISPRVHIDRVDGLDHGTLVSIVFELRTDGPHPRPYARMLPSVGAFSDWLVNKSMLR